MVKEESKDWKANTPLKGNVTANPASEKKTPKKVATGKSPNKSGKKSPAKSPTKTPNKETGGIKQPVVPSKKEKIEDSKFAAPDREIQWVKAYVDDPWFRDHAWSMFDSFDKNHNGVLEQDEVKHLAKGLTDHFKRDGIELYDARESEMTRLLQSIDYNGDGVVDFDEFHFFMKQLVLSLITIKPTEVAKDEEKKRNAKAQGRSPPPKPPVISSEELAAL